jgi:hypothetical protein
MGWAYPWRAFFRRLRTDQFALADPVVGRGERALHSSRQGGGPALQPVDTGAYREGSGVVSMFRSIVAVLTAAALVVLFSPSSAATTPCPDGQQGCCSHHRGISGACCGSGRALCNDGPCSPSWQVLMHLGGRALSRRAGGPISPHAGMESNEAQPKAILRALVDQLSYSQYVAADQAISGAASQW